MVGDFLTLPLRIGVRATSLALRGTEEVATRAFSVALKAAAVVRPPAQPAAEPAERPPSQRAEREPTEAKPAPEPGVAPEPEPEPQSTPEPQPQSAVAPEPEPPSAVTPEPAEAAAFDEPSEPEPVHVSEEPTLVEEFAEPGAEEGAGPEITVDEPWDGYAHMNAKDVISRLEQASQAELAAITLYENAHQRRQSVLSAVEHQLELVSRGGSLD